MVSRCHIALNLNGNTADDKGRRMESRILLDRSTDLICQMVRGDDAMIWFIWQ